MPFGHEVSTTKPIRVAFWLVQDSIHQWQNWIAGFYYVKHCLESIESLPVSNCPSIIAFVPIALVPKLLEATNLANAPWLEVVSISDEATRSAEGLAELTTLVESYQCDLLFPAITPPCIPFGGKVVAWITDYQHRHYPEFFPAAELTYRDSLFNFMISISTKIICSSETVRKDMTNFFPLSEDRGSVLRFTALPPSESVQSTTTIQPVLERLSIRQPYAYLPYQFWKHKNHWTVFRSCQHLKSKGIKFNIVCTGAKQDSRSPEHFLELQSYLDQHDLNEHVQILGIVSREDQWQLYRGAKFVLQPSLFEGWSTSVEEARSLGKPVLLSDIPVHREQMPDEGFFFNALDHEELAKLIERIWNRLPNGFDLESEQRAIQKNKDRQIAFGNTLVSIFHEALHSNYPNVASGVLALYLSTQYEANERLRIIHEQQKHIEYLQSISTDTPQIIGPAPDLNDSAETYSMAKLGRHLTRLFKSRQPRM